MKCTKCGFENGSDAKFCKECGSPISTKASSEQKPAEQIHNNIKSKVPIKKILFPVIAVICVVITVSIALTCVSSLYSADSVAEKFTKAMFSADADEIFKYSNIKESDISGTISKSIVENSYKELFENCELVDVVSEYSEALKKYEEEDDPLEKAFLKPDLEDNDYCDILPTAKAGGFLVL